MAPRRTFGAKGGPVTPRRPSDRPGTELFPQSSGSGTGIAREALYGYVMAAPDPWQLQLPAPAPPAADRAAGAVTAPLLDAKHAAALLGVPPSWVLAQARADRIPRTFGSAATSASTPTSSSAGGDPGCRDPSPTAATLPATDKRPDGASTPPAMAQENQLHEQREP